VANKIRINSLSLVVFSIFIVAAQTAGIDCCKVNFHNPAYGASKSKTIERKYAPDRKADILHITIDVTPDFKSRTVAGTTTIKFVPIATNHLRSCD
jgi:hypothetical protein